MDCLVEIFNNQNIIDEIDELNYSNTIKKFGEIRLIINATDRYNRYLSNIDIWIVGDISYDYIHDNINTYLSITNIPENIQTKIKWIEIIDNQIKVAIN